MQDIFCGADGLTDLYFFQQDDADPAIYCEAAKISSSDVKINDPLILTCAYIFRPDFEY